MASLLQQLRRRPLWQLCGLGVAAGLLLSVSVQLVSPWLGRLSGPADVVVLGRDAVGSNSDTIFTLRVQRGVTRITQIPRDSYINPDGWGEMKINGLLALGGPEAVERELTRLMNRPVRRHIVVKLDALPRLADLVGGIEVDVPKRMYYLDRSQKLQIDLQPGRQILRGHELTGFLRWRSDTRGDLGRLERQKLAIDGLVDRLKQPQNLVRLPQLIAASAPYLQTDLGPLELVQLAQALTNRDLSTEQLKARPFQKGGISYLETTWSSR